MTDLLQDGLGWLEEQRRKHLTRAVTYRRGSSAAEVPATVGATKFEVDDGYGTVVGQQMRDYLIATADLVLDGQQTLPERGDEILEERGGTTYVYEVMELGPDRHFRFCDPAGKTLRIHTKHVETIGE